MKHGLLLILIFISFLGHGQTFERTLSKADSLKVNSYWDKANQTNLYSVKRQLYLDSALAIMPWNAFYWQQKAMPLLKQKKYEIGMVFMDSAVKYNRKKYTDYRSFMKCIFQKHYREAITDFRQAETITPNGYVMDHSYNFYIGLCYLQLNKFDSSIYFLNKSIAHRTISFGKTWVNHTELFYLGVNYYELSAYQKAIETFDEALVIFPNFPDAKYYKGNCLVELNKKELALKMFMQTDADFKKGFTLNEDNIIYEEYPYQIKNKWVDSKIKWLQSEIYNK